MSEEIQANSFSRCTFLAESDSKSLAYCLKYHEWIRTCPNKCAFFHEGESQQISGFREKKFNFECIYFTLDEEALNYHWCSLFSQKNPFCESCQFAKIEE
ncbi:MAG: hypothetical protein ACXABI_16225 [Candidatus Hodarchaeales archaeon]